MTEQGEATVAVVFGVSGCGKTFIGRQLAQETGWTFLDADDLHPPANVRKMREGQPLDDADREPWLAALCARIAQGLADGRSTVLACSALKRSYRDRLRVDGRVRFFYLQVDRPSLEARLRQRQDHFFNPVLLDSQLQTLEPPGAEDTVDACRAPEQVIEEIRRRLAADAPPTSGS